MQAQNQKIGIVIRVPARAGAAPFLKFLKFDRLRWSLRLGGVVTGQGLYVCTRPQSSFVPQIPLRKHSSWTIWLWSMNRFTSGP